MSLKAVTTARGNLAIQYKGYTYRRDRTLTTGDINWRCISRTCSASLKTSNDLKATRSKLSVHNHPAPTSASPAQTPPATPSPKPKPKTLEDDGPASTPAGDTPTASPSPSLTELLSPYTTITPVPPTYNSLDKENLYLRQRVAELEYMADALTNRAIELDTQLLEIKKQTQIPSDTHPTTSFTPHPPPPSCEKCKILSEEAKNMIQSIRGLEEEIKTLKQQPPTTLNPNPSPYTAPPGLSNLKLRNRFQLLTNIQDPDDSFDDKEFTIVKNKNKPNKRNKTFKHKNKQNRQKKVCSNNKRIKTPFNHVTVVGDSHTRGLSALMATRTTHHTSVTGVCKPGAGLLNIEPTSTPPPNHAYVLIAGTNDVAAGRENIIFEHMEQVIKKCKKTSRVLVAPLPPRHDLSPGSPVHKSVTLVNHFISELCSRYEGVEVLDISDLGRRHHTRHGLHLNAAGKTLLASLIVNQLAQAPWPALVRRRSAEGPITATPSLSPPQPFVMNHESYADAAKTTLQPLPQYRQTDTPLNNESRFLGNPSLAAQN